MNARTLTASLDACTADLRESNDAAEIVRTQVREAVRSRPTSWPTEDITVELFGCETTATVEYDPNPAEPGDFYQEGRPAYLILGSVTVAGITDDDGRPVNLLPFIKAQHADLEQEIKDAVHEKLRAGYVEPGEDA